MEVDLFEVFLMGVDYGQFLAEKERDSEDWADAFQGCIIDQKYAMPAHQAPRRQPRSEVWRKAKKNSYENFINLIAKVKSTDEFIFIE